MNRVKTGLLLGAILAVPFAFDRVFNAIDLLGVFLIAGYLFVHVYTAGDPA